MAKGKRGNGEGTIALGVDGYWVARLTLADGRRKALYAKTRQVASRKLASAIRDRDRGIPVAGDERQTTATFLASWLETIRPAVKPRTWSRYEQAVRTHLAPALGSHRLAKLSAQHVQSCYAAALTAGLAPATVAHLHAVLHRALESAVQLELVASNAADRVTPPRATRHDMRVLTQGQAQTLLAGVAGDRLEAAYVLALALGVRQGELLALRWRDVDLAGAEGRVRITHTLHFDRGGAWRLASPKTERSQRLIEVPPLVIAALHAHRKRQLEERLAAGNLWHDFDFIFCNMIGQPLRGTHLLERHFLPTLARLGLPTIRWHDLRHTCVSLAIEQGVQVPMISQLIGHSSASMTADVYAHILPGMGRAAALAMDRALRGPVETDERGAV